MQTIMKTGKLKRRLALFVAVIMTLTLWTAVPLQASAAVDGDFRYTVSATTGNATIRAYTGNDAEITIPASIDGHPVTSIGESALKGCSFLTEVTIESGITSIGRMAFSFCTELTTVIMPASVTSVGDWAFATSPSVSINSLEPRTLPDTVINVGSGVFVIDSVKRMETEGNFRYIIIMDPATETESVNIVAYTGNTDNPVIPTSFKGDPITGFEHNVFAGCTFLTEITIPDTITNLGNDMFSGCTSLKKVTANGATSAGSNVFVDCTSLETVSLNNIENIAYGMFNGCTSLKTIGIESATNIADYALQNTGLTSIEIPASVETIGQEVFQNCTDLTKVTINGESSVGHYAFDGCTSLETVEMNAVTGLGNNVFNGCIVLKSVSMDKVTSISSGGFGGCVNLETVSISSLEAIPYGMFDGCTSLKSVSMDSAVSIGRYAFRNTGLTSITIPESVTSIGQEAFVGNTNLETVTIEGAATIGNSAFNGLTSLKTISMDKVTSIGNNAFENTGLISVLLPESVTTISTTAFGSCTALKTVTLPSTLEKMAWNMFVNCTSLTDVTVLGHTTVLNSGSNDPFDGATSLAKIWVYNDLTGNLRNLANSKSKTVVMVEAITLDKTDSGLPLKKGATETGTLAITTTPANVSTGTLETLPTVEWTSSNPNVASISGSGNTVTITAQGYGTAEITAKTTPHSGIEMQASATVTVDPPDGTTTYALTVGESVVGSYPGGAEVNITATAAETGQEFDKWTRDDDRNSFDDANAATTIFTMPAKITTVTANYRFVMPAPVIDFVEEELTGLVNDGTYTFNSADGSASDTGTADIDSDWIGKTIPIVKKAVSNVAESKTLNFAIPARPAQPTGITWTDETIDEHEDGTISGVTGLMEWSDDAGDTWTDGNGGIIDELAPGDYLVRVKAVEGTSFASAPITVTIGDGEPQTRILEVEDITFAAVTTGYSQPDAKAVTIANTGNSTANISGVTVSDTAAFEIAGSGATVDPEDEIDTWTIQPKAGLSANTYNATITVVYDNDAETTASVSFTVNASTTTTPPPSSTTYAVTVTNGTGGGTYEAGATVTIIANAAPDGKVFDTWIGSGVIFASANSATTNFIMPANAVAVTATYKEDPNTGGGGDDPEPPVNPPVDPPQAENGWVKNDDGKWEYLTGGEAKTGWLYDTNYKAWYYLASDGVMQTGWDYVGGKWYYLASNGKMQTGWLKDGGSWYYLAGNGAMVAGKWFKDTSGSWYYLSGNGKMLTGKQTIGGKVYSFKSNGVWIS